MTNDVFLVIGVVVLVLTIPSILSAILDGHAPRTAAVSLLIGGVLVFTAVTREPGGYTIEQVPDVFLRVIGNVVN